MGKGTIVSHIGDGQYRVTLNRSTDTIRALIAKVTEDLAALVADIAAAYEAKQDTESRLTAILAEITAAINAVNARVKDLSDAVHAARADVEQKTDELESAQESLDFLLAAQEADPESVTEEQIRIATEYRDGKQEALDAANDALKAAMTAWENRDADIKDQDANLVRAAELREELTAAQAKYDNLLLDQAALGKRKGWLESKLKEDTTVEAWCADLTEDLTGEVGTIEIPGERTSESSPVIIRPGYEGRAAYQATDKHQTVIDAKLAAYLESILAQDRYDAATSAFDTETASNTRLRDRLAHLYGICPFTVAEILAMDAESRAALPDEASTEIVFLDGQIGASDALLPVLEARKATMLAALTAAQEAFDGATAALAAARAADTEPRMADGMLQTIPSMAGPFSSFFNLAMLPAWQKWRPMYRVGVITEIVADTCTVLLDVETSSQQSLDVNQELELKDVAVEYMECNGDAFEVGDRVVVEFSYHDQDRPTVIGFESNPKPCSVHGLFATYTGPLLAWKQKKQALIKNGSMPPTYAFLDGVTVQGGHIAVTGALERNPDGTVKPGQKFDVFSVGTSAKGWMPGRWPTGGPIYRNGKKLSFSTVSGGFDIAPFSPDQFSGVGVRVITRNPGTPDEQVIRRLVAVAISGQGAWESQAFYENGLFWDDDPTHEADSKPGWQGDYLICYSDPPYTDLVVSQHLRIDDHSYPPYFTTLPPERPVLFFFNESCTIAAGIKNRTNRSYTGQASGIQFLDIGADGTTATPRWEDHPTDEAGGENSETWTGKNNGDTEYVRRQWARNPPRAVAIGYVGDTEKRLTVESTYDQYGYYYNTRTSLVPRTGIVSQNDAVTTYIWRVGSTAIEETVSNHELLVWPYHSTVDRVTEHIYVYGVDLASEAIWHLKAHGTYSAVNMNGTTTPTVITVGDGKSTTLYSGPEVKEQKTKPTSTSVGVGNPVDLVCCSFPYAVAMGHQHDTLFALNMPAYRYYSPAGDLFAAYYVDAARAPHDIGGQGDIPTKSAWETVGVS